MVDTEEGGQPGPALVGEPVAREQWDSTPVDRRGRNDGSGIGINLLVPTGYSGGRGSLQAWRAFGRDAAAVTAGVPVSWSSPSPDRPGVDEPLYRSQMRGRVICCVWFSIISESAKRTEPKS